MDTSQPFTVSTVFPPTPQGTALARFLILSRQAEHLRTALIALESGSAPGGLEGRLLLLGCYIGSLKELADAFRHYSNQAQLDWLRIAGPALPDIAADFKVADEGTDRSNPTSLYSKFLKHVRDNAGFHVQLKAVEGVLSTIAGASVRPAEVIGEEQTLVSVPVVELMMSFLLWSRGQDVDELVDTMADASKLHNALRNIAQDLYLLQVREATELS